MHTPRTEINVQAGLTDVRATAFVHGPVDFIHHAPSAAVQCRRRKPDASLRWLVREVDDHEMARMLTGQAPGHQVEVALVIRPSVPLAEMPLSVFEVLTAKGSKQLCVEFLKASVDRLLRATPQEDRHP